LAMMYDFGYGVPEDDKEAVKWYRLAAKQGVAEAQINLAIMYDSGYGVEEDGQKAIKWYRLVAKPKYIKANTNIYDLAKQYIPLALKILKSDAEKGIAETRPYFKNMCHYGYEIPEDYEEAVKWCQLAAERGPVLHKGISQAKMIVYLLAKRGVPSALKILKSDAENGVAEAQNDLAVMYDFGYGIEEDDQEAVKWYRILAKNKNTQAKNKLYKSVKNYIPQPFKTLLNNAKKNVARVQNSVTVVYGIPKDDKEAVRQHQILAKKYIPLGLKTLKNDAEKGFSRAQSNFGLMHDFGYGVPEDDKEAVKWYRLAAEQGVTQAQNNLGLMYDFGYGVEENDKEALKWYRLAAKQEYIPVDTVLHDLTEKGIPLALKILKSDTKNNAAQARHN